ncbi:hypothetical protein FACS189419_07870 [Planctomycetales bacterium]|nr:hypothetical protein FACS189419_07870 [Planctomycetales bacterium]
MELEKLGPFLIKRLIGRGGMGTVYEAVHEENGTPAAVKVLLTTLEEDKEVRQRFEHEIATLIHLRHPNIVRMFGYGEEQGTLYYAMEYVDGPSLQHETKKQRYFQWQEVAKIGLDICSALKHAHDRGITHRDIKPANILLTQLGEIKLSDYGIAQSFGSVRITGTHSIVGTLEYMSPEQAQGNPIGPRSDLFSLGTVLYFLLTGKLPFSARSLVELLRKHNIGSFDSVKSSRFDLPADFESIISDLLQCKPENRPANAFLVVKRFQSMLQALVGSPENIPVLPLPPPSPKDVPNSQTKVALPVNEKAFESLHNSQGFYIDDGIIDLNGIVYPETENAPLVPKTSGAVSAGNEKKERKEINTAAAKNGANSITQERLPGETAEWQPKNEGETLTIAYSTDDAKKVVIGNTPLPAVPSAAVSKIPEEPIIRHGEVLLKKAAAIRSSKDDPLSPVHDLESITKDFSEKQPAHSATGGAAQRKRTIDESRQEFTPQAPMTARKRTPEPAESFAQEISEKTEEKKEKASSRFVEVRDESDDFISESHQHRPAISATTLLTSLMLIIVGITFYYLLQPVPPDVLYKNIRTILERDDSPSGYSLSTLRQAQSTIEQFLSNYPSHPLTEQIQVLQDELELAENERRYTQQQFSSALKKFSPVELAYIEAVNISRNNITRGIAKLKALIDLYEPDYVPAHMPNTPQRLSSPVEICIELAKRRLEKLEKEVSSESEVQIDVLRHRLHEADRLVKTNPNKAEAMYRAAVELYQDHLWARELVEESRKKAEKLKKENLEEIPENHPIPNM